MWYDIFTVKYLSRKEKGFVTDVLKGVTPTLAALKNYDTESYGTAGVIAHENLKKPKIRKAIEEAFPDDFLEQIHKEGLFATKGIYRQTDDYTWTKIDEVPDHPTIKGFLDMAYKLKGSYAAEKKVNLNLHAEIEPSPKVKDLAKKLNYGGNHSN